MSCAVRTSPKTADERRGPVVSLVRVAALLLPLTVGATASLSDCRDESICVDTVVRGEALELYARNLRDFAVTYTLEVDTQWHTADGAAVITRTLAPRQSEKAMSLTARGTPQAPAISLDWSIGERDANHDDDHLYALPYARGRSFEVLQGYNARTSHRGHEAFAVDFAMPQGTPVHATRAGIVARVVDNHARGCWEPGCSRYANFIVVLHNDGTTGAYYHLQRDGALVKTGDSVRRGQHIAFSGNTGRSKTPHLHFAVYRAGAFGEQQSLPVRFQSADGIISAPRRGSRHQAVY